MLKETFLAIAERCGSDSDWLLGAEDGSALSPLIGCDCGVTSGWLLGRANASSTLVFPFPEYLSRPRLYETSRISKIVE